MTDTPAPQHPDLTVIHDIARPMAGLNSNAPPPSPVPSGEAWCVKGNRTVPHQTNAAVFVLSLASPHSPRARTWSASGCGDGDGDGGGDGEATWGRPMALAC